LRDSLTDGYIAWRQSLVKELGGLPPPQVKNKEWLYMLKNETRNSIMVEGIFVNENELEAVISGNNRQIRGAADILNYFRTAGFIYGLGYENFSNNELILSRGLIRQINKGVLDGLAREPGELRKGKVVIGGAKIQPPEFDLENWLDLYIQWVKEKIDTLPVIQLIALQHGFFEAVHPFEDGNGRTGRILTNYLLLSRGFPLVTVKGDNPSREVYYTALQQSDLQLVPLFKDSADYERLCAALEKTGTTKLEKLFFKGLRESMDRILVSLLEQRGEAMLPAEELAASLGYSPGSIRKLVERGKLIAVIRGKTHYSHPSLLHERK
jgi:Fic family protein